MPENSRFIVQWVCPCGKVHKTPACQKCGDFPDGWEALKSGWRFSMKAVKSNFYGGFANEI